MNKVWKIILVLFLSINIGFMNADVVSAEENDIEIMKNRWKKNLTGTLEVYTDYLEDDYVNAFVSQLSDESEKVYELMNKANNGSLWAREPSERKSAYLTRNFKNVELLAQAYSTYGTSFYGDEQILEDIKRGLEYLYYNEKYNGEKYYGNWWDWQIGIPHSLLNTLFLIGDKLEANIQAKYISALEGYVPNPEDQLMGLGNGEVFTDFRYVTKTQGTNRIDFAFTRLGIGILTGSKEVVFEALNSIVDEFNYTDSGNGFYSDGSFIFHEDNPYIGSYGMDLIKGVSKILRITNDTSYDMDKDLKNQFIRLVHDSTLPFIYDGKVMSMVEGRAISRERNQTETGKGSRALKSLILASDLSDDEFGRNIRLSVKKWVDQNKDFYLEESSNFEELLAVLDIINWEIDASDYRPFVGPKMFSRMDRFVYGGESYHLGISMHSDRVSAFTVGNGENLKGWHLSDGVTYFLNSDKQYGKSYWPTVDFYRLPGTTVDTRPLDDARADWQSHLSTESTVGGAYSNSSAAIMMKLNKNGAKNNKKDIGMNLVANKSWFIVEDSLVALGSNITGSSHSSIETIVENRLMDDMSGYILYNSAGEPIADGEYEIKANDYLRLEGDVDSFTYLFLEDTIINVITETNTGSYKEINTNESDKKYTETYKKIIINHGNVVKNDTYAYSVLVNKDLEFVDKFIRNIKLVRNTKDIAAIKNISTNELLFNVFSKTGSSLLGYEVNRNGSFIIQDNEKTFDFYISNTDQRNQFLELKTNKHYEGILGSNLIEDEYGKLSFDFMGSKGATHKFTLNKVNILKLEEIINKIGSVDYKELTIHSQIIIDDLKKEGRMLVKKPNVSKSEIESFETKVDETLKTLEKRLDIHRSLNNIKEFNDLDSSLYTEKSWREYEDSVLTLKQILKKYNAFEKLIINQKDLDVENDLVEIARNQLQPLKELLDYSILESRIKEVESMMLVTKNRVDAVTLSVKLNQIDRRMKDLKLLQQDVDDMIEELEKIIEIMSKK